MQGFDFIVSMCPTWIEFIRIFASQQYAGFIHSDNPRLMIIIIIITAWAQYGTGGVGDTFQPVQYRVFSGLIG